MLSAGCTLATDDNFPLGLMDPDFPLKSPAVSFSLTLEIRTTASLLAQGSLETYNAGIFKHLS